ncbi:undecaprenyldiphospho-muramoylpentapeptide beta-N-acetylglucosaminyltransferase [Chelativorans sp. Marseille-P2723]|uniref:undecaprenyldiphospho-muramoylpentapeptide beta-N-acetylglucosaminyltransferase n=1 Tax=Chelativorans sp. Marseille-P2723 TaxID=2709133 RepID=UPI00156F33D1|nr:undecaprenyldiphospho-muramoylpentapeptide beta-N-acetylglucosaminyltransferase [Chelativorans sp. Marseille-P2723]
MADQTVLLCAGGTGGHLFPAQALGDALAARGWEVHLVTDRRAARYAGAFPANKLHTIEAATFSSRNPLALLNSMLTIWRGVRQSSALIARLRPKVVVGFGGYPTLPPLFAATRRRVPTIIHEQNAVMGRTNRMLAPRVTAIAGGFLKAEGPHAPKIVETGNPVRQAVLDAAVNSYEAPQDGGPVRLLIFGGSQGARFFSEMMPEIIARLPDALRAHLAIVQQARPEDEERLRERYRVLSVDAEVATFFSNLPARMAQSHLVISRAGASTVLELAVIGRPAVLVPLPHALDDDQSHNARLLVEAGAAIVRKQQDIRTDTLAAELAALLQDAPRLAAMAVAARTVARTNATSLMAALTEAVAAGQTIEDFRRGAAA